jgi:hypothetical protein
MADDRDKALLVEFCDFLCDGKWVPSLDYECVYAFLAARQPQVTPHSGQACRECQQTLA